MTNYLLNRWKSQGCGLVGEPLLVAVRFWGTIPIAARDQERRKMKRSREVVQWLSAYLAPAQSQSRLQSYVATNGIPNSLLWPSAPQPGVWALALCSTAKGQKQVKTHWYARNSCCRMKTICSPTFIHGPVKRSCFMLIGNILSICRRCHSFCSKGSTIQANHYWCLPRLNKSYTVWEVDTGSLILWTMSWNSSQWLVCARYYLWEV